MPKIGIISGVFLFLWRISKSQQPHRVRDWSGILLETEAGDGGGSGGEKRYSGKPDGDSRNAQKKIYIIYLLVPIQVHLCQMYSNGPCLCLPSHHLQKSSCIKKVKSPMSRLKVYPQYGAKYRPNGK